MRALLLPFLTAFGLSVALVPLVRALARAIGAVALPQQDSPQRPPTALFGGVAVALTVLACAVGLDGISSQPALLVCGLTVFLIGLTDEVVGLQPAAKIAAQIVLASVFLFFGYRLGWTQSLTLDSLLTVLWIVGITNAYNRLDSRDGLCAGVAFIAGLVYLLKVAPVMPDTPEFLAARYAAILIGAVAGFLVYNVHPASVFLGDSGGLFIGLSLGVLALAPGHGPVGDAAQAGTRPYFLPILLAPAAVLLVPILGNSVATFSWVILGRSPTPSGLADPWRRMLAFLHSERRVVWVHWTLAALVSAAGLAMWQHIADSLVLLGYVLLVTVMIFVVALACVGVDDKAEVSRNYRRIAPVVADPSYGWRTAEVMFDLCLVFIAYYGAYRLRFPDAQVYQINFYFFLNSLPIVLAGQILALFGVGAYRGGGTFLGAVNAMVLAKAVFLGAVGVQLVLLYVYRFENYPRVAFAAYVLLVFLLLTGSRVSCRLIRTFAYGRPQPDGRVASGKTGATRKSRRRRVARIITRLNIGGPAIQAVSLSQRMHAFGYDTLLVYGALAPGEGDMRYLLTPGMATQEVRTLGRAVVPLRDLRAWWSIYRTLCRFRPEIVHTHTAKAGAVGRLAAIAYNATAGRHRRACLVHTYHGHVFEGYFGSASTGVFIGIERWLARRTDVLVAISPRIKADLIDSYRIAPARQVHTIPLGFELSAFAAIDNGARARARVSLGIQADESVVTTVGRLTEIKQHDLFLEMAKHVSQHRKGVVFLIAGDGDLRDQLQALAAECGLGGSVRFLGWRTDLTTIYAATDVFVLTSRNEGTPVALIEAMASGVTGVSTDVGGVRDVILCPEVGILVPFGDAESLGVAVMDLLASPETRRAMGRRARDAVLSRFYLDRLLSDIATLYDEVLPDS